MMFIGSSCPRLALFLLLSSLFNVVSFPSDPDDEYKPIDSLEVAAYLGRWYQMYTTIPFILLELGGRCVTADYELIEDGKISLVNQARPWLVPQIFARTTGVVVQGDDFEGAFTVAQTYITEIDPDDVEYESPGNYWIIGLGPNVDDEYQWAAVSDPSKATSFILARDPEGFKGSQYEQDALDVFEMIGGFDTPLNKLLPTSHVACLGYPDK